MISVFFYGLFMDPDLLKDKGLNPGACESALCYILTPAQLRGQNGSYARSLAIVARKLDLPAEYIREIETWMK